MVVIVSTGVISYGSLIYFPHCDCDMTCRITVKILTQRVIFLCVQYFLLNHEQTPKTCVVVMGRQILVNLSITHK